MFSISSRLTYAAVCLRKQLADQNRIARVSVVSFIIFIGATYFIKGLHALPVASVILTAVLSLQSGVAADTIRRNAWFWLFLAFLGTWVALGLAVGRPGYKGSDFLNLALLGACFLFVAQVSRALSTRQILSIVAIAGGASALASIVLHIVSAHHLFDRMVPLGRGGNSIPGAGGFAIALIAVAAMSLDRAFERRVMLVNLVLMATLLAGLAWTQSRAPIIACGLALPLAFWLNMRGGRDSLLAACGAMWFVITGLILFEPSIKAMFCSNTADWCRPTYRMEIWGWVREQIALHPLIGSGPGFRFAKEWMSHPHNGMFGIAMYFGLPALVAFGSIIVLYAKKLAGEQDRTLRFFGQAALIFTFGYMGADLSNPFAFFNIHYIFLWLPFFLVLASRQEVAQHERGVASLSPEGLQRI